MTSFLRSVRAPGIAPTRPDTVLKWHFTRRCIATTNETKALSVSKDSAGSVQWRR